MRCAACGDTGWHVAGGRCRCEAGAEQLALDMELRRARRLVEGDADAYADLQVDHGRPFPEELADDCDPE